MSSATYAMIGVILAAASAVTVVQVFGYIVTKLAQVIAGM